MEVLDRPMEIDIARTVVRVMGGRYSVELGIDVDGGDDEIERWFVAASLFGTRISGRIATRTFRVLDDAGLTRMALARRMSWQRLVDLLDQGGYVRYDFRTATRMQALAKELDKRYGGRVARISDRHADYPGLRSALDELPGWGPVTIGLFLRELRGVWPGAQPPLDDRATNAARHVGLLRDGVKDGLGHLRNVAQGAALDVRDLECGLVRLSLAHHVNDERCRGGPDCTALHPAQSDAMSRSRARG